MPASRAARWIVLPDVQLPYEDKPALRAVEKYMADHRWDGWIQLGDLIDFDEISRWNDGNRRMDKTAAIKRSYDYAGAFLDRHAALVRARNKSARMVFIEGNHEDRISRYLEKNPEGVGMLEIPNALNLAGRRIEWVPFWSRGDLFRLGKAYFAHGRYTNRYHAQKHLDTYGINIYYGHLHTMQVHSKRTLGKNETKEAACLGCLCRHDLSYLRGGPTDWQLGFAVFHVWPDGFYQHYTVRIFKNRFVSPEGKEYHG